MNECGICRVSAEKNPVANLPWKSPHVEIHPQHLEKIQADKNKLIRCAAGSNIRILTSKAVRIAARIRIQSSALTSSDENLIEAITKTGLRALDVTEDEENLRAFIIN